MEGASVDTGRSHGPELSLVEGSARVGARFVLIPEIFHRKKSENLPFVVENWNSASDFGILVITYKGA